MIMALGAHYFFNPRASFEKRADADHGFAAVPARDAPSPNFKGKIRVVSAILLEGLDRRFFRRRLMI